MTSTQALKLANQIIQNDPGAAEPLIKLLSAFRRSHGDPLGEAMMRKVVKSLYAETDHCEEVGLASFLGEADLTDSVAA